MVILRDSTMTFPPASAIRLPARPESSARDGSSITLSTHELGAGPAVVFCHGFPDLALGWRHQLEPVARAGFRAIAPDQRGYGGSSAPAPIEAYGLTELTGDLVGLLDALEIERAVFVGHDWGGFVAWAMPILHPERVLGVAGICTPYMPFPSVTKHLAIVGGEVERQYVAWFQQPGVAEAEMDPRVRPILTRILRTGAPLEQLVRIAFADGRLDMIHSSTRRSGRRSASPSDLRPCSTSTAGRMSAPASAAGSTGIATSIAMRPSIRRSADAVSSCRA